MISETLRRELDARNTAPVMDVCSDVVSATPVMDVRLAALSGTPETVNYGDRVDVLHDYILVDTVVLNGRAVFSAPYTEPARFAAVYDGSLAGRPIILVSNPFGPIACPGHGATLTLTLSDEQLQFIAEYLRRRKST